MLICVQLVRVVVVVWLLGIAISALRAACSCGYRQKIQLLVDLARTLLSRPYNELRPLGGCRCMLPLALLLPPHDGTCTTDEDDQRAEDPAANPQG